MSIARAKLTRFAGDFARDQLGLDAPTDDIAACAAYMESVSAANHFGFCFGADSTSRFGSMKVLDQRDALAKRGEPFHQARPVLRN